MNRFTVMPAAIGAVARGLGTVFGAALAVLLAGMPGPSRAQDNSVESITASQQGNSTVLRLQMKAPLREVPPNFSVTSPPRLAFDFADTANGMGRNTVELSQGDVRSVNVVQAAGRSRLVMNLRRPVIHTARLEGSALIVALEPVVASTAGSSVPATGGYTFARADGSAGHALRDIDFRRGKDGEGRVVVELSDAKTGVDVKLQGQSIVVDFLKARLPDNLRRRLDVGDFGTPVRSVRTFQQGENTRMVIEPSGLWEHNAYQSDTQFVLEVKPVRDDPNKLALGSRPGYRGEKLSLNFQNVDVRALLQVIADFTNLNIVVRDSVAGSLTLRLKDVPWDQALDIVLQSKNLDMRKSGNVILVAPREELATQEKLELESKQQIAEIEPMRVEVFQLNYQKADAVAKLLSDEKQKVLSKGASAVPDQRTNKVFVRDTASRLEEVRRIVSQLDIPVRQVLIEARIVEADDRFSRNLGVKFGMNDIRSTIYRTAATVDPVSGQTVGVNVPVYGAGTSLAGGAYSTLAGNLQGVADLSSQLGSSLQGINAQGLGRATALGNTNFVNLPAGSISGADAASFAISLFGSSLTRFVNLEISALEAEQRGKVVSSPRVLTSDQGRAVIEQGTELPYQTATSSGATAITFRKANLKLEVVPQITPEGNVIMRVQINRDAVGQLTPAGFAIDTRAVQTEVLVENGGTVVIGGIYEQFERNRINKVPVLGDIPYLGNLFKNNARTNDRTELLVFLTPRVVSDVAAVR